MRLRPLVPRAIRPYAGDVVLAGARVWLRGDRIECPCCGGRFRDLLRYPSLLCPGCRSYERQRALALWLDRGVVALPRDARVLHVGPEPSLEPRLRAAGHYVSIDLDPGVATHQMDVQQMTFADGAFDVAVCLHVLVLVPDVPRAARELHRVLVLGGRVIVCEPKWPGEQRPAVEASFEGAGFTVETLSVAESFDDAAIARHALDPDEVFSIARRA